MIPSVVIDCFPSSVSKYGAEYAVVAIDVIRATTSAITAVLAGRRCFPAATLEDAHALRQKLGNAVLAGELGGEVPPGFDLNNSPAELAELKADERAIVLLSTSGTQLMCLAAAHEAAYIASLRNYRAVAGAIAGRYEKVAIIGAGSRNEFREEDQMCCAWIADLLLASGFEPENSRTMDIIGRWRGVPADACATFQSAEYLRRSRQTRDLDFTLSHINDLDASYTVEDGEVVLSGELVFNASM